MELTYRQDREASAEILRLALQKMGGQPAAFTPHAYAVWYEHLAGINAPLSEAMGKVLSGEAKLGDELAQAFFEAYVTAGNEEAQRVFRQNMDRVIDNLALFTEATGQQTDRFSADLQKYGDTLTRNLDEPALKNVINEISRDTRSMRKSVNSLQDKLQESKSEVEKLQRELQNAKSEAQIDPMTKVLNRRGFDARMQQLAVNPELAGKRVSFLMLDIDFFKKVNDCYGHLFGDRVICAIASALTAQVKGQDSVARLGGEEFAVVLPDTPLAGAYAVAEHIRLRIGQSKIRRLDNQEFVGGVTISIGVSDCPIGADFTAALARADEALYASKKAGRNRTTVCSDAAETAPARRA
ncbi:MAG TPA: diguanylate cyclase [Rhodocyclaceae bacterium]|nr:diguanylate cyclase [Rhodocyclaceae bacterium]